MARGRKAKEVKAVYNKLSKNWEIYLADGTLVKKVKNKEWIFAEADYFGYKAKTDFVVDVFYNNVFNLDKDPSTLKSLRNELASSSKFITTRTVEDIQYLYKKKAYEKHKKADAQRKEVVFDARMAKIDDMIQTLSNIAESDYTSLKRILKPYISHLTNLLEHSKLEFSRNKNLKYLKEAKYTFPVSIRHFNDNYNVNTNVYKTAKVFKLLCVLGFVSKDFEDAEKYDRTNNEYNITYFKINDLNLENSEAVAHKLLSNNYNINKITRKYISDVFGLEVAELIFANTKKENKLKLEVEAKEKETDKKIEKELTIEDEKAEIETVDIKNMIMNEDMERLFENYKDVNYELEDVPF